VNFRHLRHGTLRDIGTRIVNTDLDRQLPNVGERTQLVLGLDMEQLHMVRQGTVTSVMTGDCYMRSDNG